MGEIAEKCWIEWKEKNKLQFYDYDDDDFNYHHF